MLKQTLQQKQQLKLTPQQMLVQKLLLLPVPLMEQRIKEEIESNPALEEISDSNSDSKDEQDILSPTDGDESNTKSESKDDDFDPEEFMEENDEYVPAYKLSVNNSNENDSFDIPVADNTSFLDSLNSQLSELNLNERQHFLGEYIIGNIDDDGYLRRDLYSISNDITFQHNLLTDEKELEGILKIIQEFEPTGVGARDLRECLLIQLKKNQHHDEAHAVALQILENGFEEFSKKNYEKLKEIVKADEPILKEAVNEILKLNPKPGLAFSDESDKASQVVPDFVVSIYEGKPEANLTNRVSSSLRLNQVYIDMSERKKGMDKMKKEAASFAHAKTELATGFISALKQREETLLSVMKSILAYQEEYFISGDENKLKPMLLKDVAKVTGLDISTISRVVSSKYVQTNFGTILLKKLFSESFHKESGEDVSVNEVKTFVREAIENEDKKNPVNDEALMALLEEKGYKVARRTIAKYREQMGIPVARMRKQI